MVHLGRSTGHAISGCWTVLSGHPQNALAQYTACIVSIQALTNWDLSRRGTTRAEDAQETPAQSDIIPSLLVCEEKRKLLHKWTIQVIVEHLCSTFVFCFFFTLVTGPGRSLGLELSDTRVNEP